MTKTCLHCGRTFKRRKKREGRLAIVPRPDCGRCWIQIDKVEGTGSFLAYSTVPIP
jgi:hypothetical protein